MKGSAEGSFSLRSVCHRFDSMDWKSISVSASTAYRPAAVSTITGKKAMNIAMTIFEFTPKPNQATKTGAKATLGSALSATR